MKTPATKLRHQITAYLARLRASGVPLAWTHYPGGPTGRRGEPDLFCVVAGRPLLIEIKAGRDRLTKIQEHRLRQWRRAGAVAIVATSVVDVEHAVMSFHDHHATSGRVTTPAQRL